MADAIASAPNPTWDRPSPIMEYLLRTSVTPSTAAHRATRTPMHRALTMKGYVNISAIR